MRVGFEKVKGWECLYFHRAKKLFLSAYVDDYKMAGTKSNLQPMWDLLRKEGLDLEPAVSLKSNVYLGCGQREVKPDLKMIATKREMFHRLCLGGVNGKPDNIAPADLLEESELPEKGSKTPAKSKEGKKKNSTQGNLDVDSKILTQGNLEVDSKSSSQGASKAAATVGSLNQNVSAYVYEMFGHVKQSVERYLEL